MNRKNKKPWPTEAAMEQIYKMKLWGTNNDSFYSGFGSHDTKIVTPYLEVVKSFLSSFEEPLVVCDLGCGDFNVGKELVKYTKKYIAVDIVSDLITYNRERFTPLFFFNLIPCPEIISLLASKFPLGKCSVKTIYLNSDNLLTTFFTSSLDKCCKTCLTKTQSPTGKLSTVISRQ